MLRLRLPAEVKASESKCQRSKVTGSLLVVMPKVTKCVTSSCRNQAKINYNVLYSTAFYYFYCFFFLLTNFCLDDFNFIDSMWNGYIQMNPRESAVTVRVDLKPRSTLSAKKKAASSTPLPRKLSLQEQIVASALEAGAVAPHSSQLEIENGKKGNSRNAVDISNIVKNTSTSSEEPIADGKVIDKATQRCAGIQEI